MQLRGTAIVVDTVASKKPVISGSDATRTLNETESGSVVLFDRPAGIQYTLPTPKPGLNYEFVVSQGITTGFAKVVANVASSSPVFVGHVDITTDTGAATTRMVAGSSVYGIASNGTTTGARASGSRYVVTALSSNTWHIQGLMFGTGTLVTPFLSY